MAILEAEGTLDRSIENLPTTDDMHERARSGIGMVSPEMSVLLAYAKRSLRRWLLDSELPDWQDFSHVIDGYFPPTVVDRFGHLVADHPLRRELIATIVANRVVNSEGVTFVTRLMSEAGAAPEQVVRAYHIARDVVDAPERWRAVEAIVGDVSPDVARAMMNGVDNLVESVARWYLDNPGTKFMSQVISESRPAFEELCSSISEIGHAQWRSTREALVADWVAKGAPLEIAHRHVYGQELIHAPDIIEVALHTGRSVTDVADVFFLAGSAFEIDWLETQVATLPLANRWQRRAIQTVNDDLVLVRRLLAERILSDAPGLDPQTALDRYLVARTHEIGRLTRFMRSLAGDGVTDVAAVIVAIRQIRNLVN